MISGCHKINRSNINTKDYWDRRVISNNTNNGTSALESILEWIYKNKVNVNKETRVLDIGSGPRKPGSFLVNIFEKYNCECHSFDISEEIKKTWDGSGITGHCGVLPETGLENKYFDLILCSHTLEHVDKLEDSCNEIKKVL